MLDDAFTHLESQIESAKRGIAKFEVFDDTKRVQVVIERKTVLAHGGVKSFFSGMAKGWMADVVDQRQRFDEIAVESELRGDCPRDLCNFDRVRQAVAKVVGVAAREDLSLCFQTAKCAGVDYAVAIALKVVAVEMRRLGMAASAGMFNVDGVGGELGVGGQLPVPSCQFTACV
jgi:hypothetical protein